MGERKLHKVVLIAFLVCFFGIVSARLLPMLEEVITGESAKTRMYGAFLISPLIQLVIGYIFKLNIRGFFDVTVVASIPTFCVLRLFCYYHGCCGGKEILSTGWRWPTRESELIFFLIMFIVFFRRINGNYISGQLFPQLMIYYGCFRFINEWFRRGTNIGGGLHLAHIWSIICVVAGMCIYFELKNQEEKKHRRKRKGIR